MSAEPTDAPAEAPQDEFSNIQTEGNENPVENNLEDELAPVEIEEDAPKLHAGALLMGAKVLSTVAVDEQVKAKSAEDKHAATAMKVGDKAAAFISGIGESVSTTLRTQTTDLASKNPQKEGEQPATKIDETVSATATAGAAGIKAAATAVGFASDMFRKLVGVAGAQTSNYLYSRHGDTMRSPGVVKTKKVFVGYLVALITVITAVFAAVGKIVESMQLWFSEFIGTKYGQDAKKLTFNIVTVLIYAFHFGLAASLMGIKGIIITFIIFFIVSVITKIEDPNETKPNAV